jgi:alkanesulfonate monooxygenase
VSLRFHWRLPQTGEDDDASRAAASARRETGVPDIDALTRFSKAAETSGMDSLLVDFGWAKPDPIMLSAAVGARTDSIRFLIAWRSGLISPTMFVQQLNTLSTIIGGRLSLNIVAGHSPQEQRGYGDFLPHDDRYARTEEFLAICNAFWRGEQPVDYHGAHYTIEQGRVSTPFQSPVERWPEIYIAGNSPQAREVAIGQGSCWMLMAETPEKMRALTPPVLAAGKTVGVRLCVIARKTRDEARRAARELVKNATPSRQLESGFINASDSATFRERYQTATSGQEWLTPVIWTGALRSHGPASTSLVGSPDDIAETILDYAAAGVTQFIFSGWPKLEEMLFFAGEVLPRVRRSASNEGDAA